MIQIEKENTEIHMDVTAVLPGVKDYFPGIIIAPKAQHFLNPETNKTAQPTKWHTLK